ncbi:MAG: beta-ketoacyl synthase chain length factor [Planctomycetes bacterium]|nr:beta-ketoacyl synthase chain length factor [Planctomycetota bacterium]
MKVAVTGIGLWTPRCVSAAAWAEGERADVEQKPVGLAFDKRNRRRVSALGRAIGDAVEEAIQMAAVDPVIAPVIVGSAIGEASTMIGLLDQMWRTREPMSPAAFTVSVHNAASGMLSISKRNVGFTTSIAADHDTPIAVLLEGAAIVVATGTAVVVVCADEASPQSLMGPDAVNWDMLAAAVVLAPTDGASAAPASRLAELELPVQGPATIAPARCDDLLAGNPQIGLLDLIDAIQRGDTGILALDRGAGRGSCVELRGGSASR